MAFSQPCPRCGRVVLKISWSALRNQETCKQRGFQIRSGHRAPLTNSRVFFPGTVVDRVVRDWLLTDPSPGLMPDMVETIMEREWKTILDEGGVITWRNSSDRAAVLSDCREAVTKIEPSLNTYVVPYEYQADKGFKVPVLIPHPAGGTEEILLNGYMDIEVKDDQGRFWIWDVKMTRNNDYWRKTVGQLTFYALSVLLSEGVLPVRVGLLQPMCDERVKAFAVTPDVSSQMMQRITGMARDIWTGEKTPRSDTAECSYCEVRHACTRFQPVVIDGKRRVAF